MTYIPHVELEQFLHEANKSTYANKDVPKVTPSRLGSQDYHFEKGDLMYHDTYFGARDFIGAEIVYKKDIPVWGANYYGYMLDPSLSERELYSFLRIALLQEYDDIVPVRGPHTFTDGLWRYDNAVNGDLSRFRGREEIWQDNSLVYEAHYHGGFIC